MSNVSSSSYTTPSGMTGAGGGNMLRITGMATGLDVDAMVKKMMAAEQTKLDKAKQDQQIIQWKQDAYQSIIKDIKDLQSSFFDSSSSDKNILSSMNFSPFTVSGVGGAALDTSVATFTPGVGAQTGTYSINVSQIAKSASRTGSLIAKNISSGFTQNNWDGAKIGFVINGSTNDQVISLNATHSSLADTVDDINTQINNNSSLKGIIQAVADGGKIQFRTLSSSSVKISSNTINTTVANDLGNLKGRVINPNTSTVMSDLGLSSAGTIKFNYNGTDYSVSVNTTDKISDVINNISSVTSGLVKASYSELSGSFSMQSVDTGSSQSIKIISDFSALGLTTNSTQVGTSVGIVDNTGNAINGSTTMSSLGMNSQRTLSFSYNGTSYNVTVNTGDSIDNVITNIYSANNNVTASFDYSTGEFKLASIDGNDIKILSDFTTLGLKADSANGKDAIVSIMPPGALNSTLVTKSTNNFTIDGMTYSLSGTGSALVNVGTDTQKVYDKIKNFIDKYNIIVDEIQTKLTEKPDSNYKPLTDSQKSSMSESQITAWETKAKVGILRNDDNLQVLLNDLKTAFNSGVNNTLLSIGRYGSKSFGIDTADYSNITNPNHIYIVDESKLKATISSNSDQILKIFTNVSSKTDADDSKTYNNTKIQYQEDGIFTRINKVLQANVGFTNTTFNSAVLTSYANTQYDYSSTGGSGKNTLPDQLYEQQLMIKKITDEMSTKQDAYYQQFSQLETAMNQLNAQQSMLSSMISG